MFLDCVFHIAETRVSVLVLESQVLRVLLRECFEFVGLRLRQINNSPVVAKIRGRQLRIFVESESFLDEPIKMPREEVGQIERTWLSFPKFSELGFARKKFVAVRTWQPLDIELSQNLIKLPAGTAISICHENVFKILAMLFYRRPHGSRYFFRSVVELCGQALNLYMRPVITFLQCDDFFRQRAARN